MRDTWITDLTHYLGLFRPDANFDPRAYRIAAFFGGIAMAATVAEPGRAIQTALRCRRRPDKVPCQGRLLVFRQELPPEIQWQCPLCGDHGLIRSWQGTPWDLAPRVQMSDEVAIPLTGDEYETLRGIQTLNREALVPVYGAHWQDGRAVLSGDIKNLVDLGVQVTAEMNREQKAGRKRLLDTILSGLEAAQSCQPAAKARVDHPSTSAKVRLSQFIDAMQGQMDEGATFLDRRTGEIVFLSSEMLDAADEFLDGEPPDSLGEDEENIRLAAAAMESNDYLELPGKYEIHEYRIMEAFCLSLPDGRTRDLMLNAIRGSGAFRRFKINLDILALRDEWYAFRDARYKEIAIEWCEDNRIACIDDTGGRGNDTL